MLPTKSYLFLSDKNPCSQASEGPGGVYRTVNTCALLQEHPKDVLSDPEVREVLRTTI